MVKSKPTPSTRIRGALRLFEGDAGARSEESMIEARYSRTLRPGTTYPSYLGPLTVLSMVNSEVCYFQGGLVYFVHESEFAALLKSQSIRGFDTTQDSFGTRLISAVEVEFILGIVATVGPMACWMFLGNDLAEFIRNKRKKLGRWTAQIASIFLARMMLKKYAIVLYQRLSGLHADAAWSSLSEAALTDDASIFRFTGRLLGHYGSEELVDRAIAWQQSVFSCIFQGLKTILDASLEEEPPTETQQQVLYKDFLDALGRLGVRISSSDQQLLLQAIQRHRNEVSKCIELISPEFENELASPPNGQHPTGPARSR